MVVEFFIAMNVLLVYWYGWYSGIHVDFFTRRGRHGGAGGFYSAARGWSAVDSFSAV